MTVQGSPAIMLEAPGEDCRAQFTLSSAERARNDMSGKLPQHGRFGRVSVGSGPRRGDVPAILPGTVGMSEVSPGIPQRPGARESPTYAKTG